MQHPTLQLQIFKSMNNYLYFNAKIGAVGAKINSLRLYYLYFRLQSLAKLYIEKKKKQNTKTEPSLIHLEFSCT